MHIYIYIYMNLSHANMEQIAMKSQALSSMVAPVVMSALLGFGIALQHVLCVTSTQGRAHDNGSCHCDVIVTTPATMQSSKKLIATLQCSEQYHLCLHATARGLWCELINNFRKQYHMAYGYTDPVGVEQRESGKAAQLLDKYEYS